MYDEMIKRVELIHLLKLSTRLIGATNEKIQRNFPISPVIRISRTLGTAFQTTPQSSPQKLTFDANLNKFAVNDTCSEGISVHPMLSMER